MNHSSNTRRQNQYTAIVFAFSIFLSLFALKREGIPSPIVHDEHAYLLAADTFASGHLANPVHPHAEFFSTYHVLMEPVYASKYMPGQGLLLALGQITTGEPIFGVILSVALLCAALCWMLQGYFRAELALLGGLIAAVNFSFYHYWSLSYWGGALTALGAVLVFGSLSRILERQYLSSISCAIGICLLMLTRPFEGFLFCLVPAFVIIQHWHREGWTNRPFLLQCVLPISTFITCCGGFILYYNHTLTGNAFTFAQRLYAEQTFKTPLFIWDSGCSEPTFPFERMKIFYQEWILPKFTPQDSVFHRLIHRLQVSSHNLLGYTLMNIPLIGLFLKCNKTRLWIRLILLINGGMLIAVYPYHPHYAAPLVVIAYFCLIDLINELVEHKRILIKPLAISSCILIVLGISLKAESRSVFYKRQDPLSYRRDIEAQLEANPGKDLIFVHYQNYNVHSEWVYNKANIDESEVVWARSLGIEKNQTLIEYYPQRNTWMLLAHNNGIRLIPYKAFLSLKDSQ